MTTEPLFTTEEEAPTPPEPIDPTVADVSRLGYVGAVPGKRDSDSWFTPDEYVDAARVALGGTIALDPFSPDVANERIRAARYFTEEDDAFVQDWSAALAPAESRTVWMNPPYSGALCSAAVSRFLDEFEAGTFDHGVFLVNNATDTKWFQRAMTVSSALLFTAGRISFWNAHGKKKSGNTRGQAFLYFGNRPALFAEAFKEYGTTVLPLQGR